MKIKKRFSAFTLAIIIAISMLSFSACAENEKSSLPARGVDISSWQSEVDFSALKKEGISFVILRIGTSFGKDSKFEKYYREAKSAGLDIGVYFYTYAKDVNRSEVDAQNVLKWLRHKKLQYPVYFDIEDDSLLNLTTENRMSICERFRLTLEDKRYLVGVYANENWMNHYLDYNVLRDNYEIWLATWTISGKPEKNMNTKCRVWQYSDKGRFNSVKGNVDLNISYFDYPAFVQKNGYNNYPKQEKNDDVLIIGDIYKICNSNTDFLTGTSLNNTKIGTINKGKTVCVTRKKEADGSLWGNAVVNGVEGWLKLDDAKKISEARIFLAKDSKCKIDYENKMISGLKSTEQSIKKNVFADNLYCKLVNTTVDSKLGFVFDDYVIEEFQII